MNNNIVIIILIALISLFILLILEKIIDFNPFKNLIKVSENFVDKIGGNELKLDKNTNSTNPLLKVNTKPKNKNSNSKKHKNLVFTSAGDNTKFDELWIGPNQNYDVMVVYYGKNDKILNKYSQKVDYILQRKGSKFQNFHYIYENHKDILDKYERFFILDDDIIFGVDEINEMFRLSKKYNFWICGPTFKITPECKISHEITKTKNKKQFRYVNFIEVNVPLFNRKALDNLMKYYDPVLIGWGIDYIFIWANGREHKDKYALIDAITCINPQDDTKGGKRELHLLKNAHQRAAEYQKFANKYGIKDIPAKNWSIVKL